ncbi:MAG TPA: hypothetical protein VGR51_03015 [Thermoplasmata archaeon]|jgi:hypothetical protein|nr:hypothetical protein [Thermoplasmata archaeon]
MPALSHTETLGFAEIVAKAIEGEAEALRKIGVDPEKLIERILTRHRRASGLNARQESLKRDTVSTTAEYVEAIKDLYVVSSGGLDILLAAMGKNTDAAKNMRQMRSRIRRRKAPTADKPAET